MRFYTGNANVATGVRVCCYSLQEKRFIIGLCGDHDRQSGCDVISAAKPLDGFSRNLVYALFIKDGIGQVFSFMKILWA